MATLIKNGPVFVPAKRQKSGNMIRVGISLLLLGLIIVPAIGHEGHRPLPTRGMEVDGTTGRIVLTSAVRKTLDVRTAEAVPHLMFESIVANATLVSPWDRHAMISSPLAGRIVDLLVSPGQTVTTGQPLAELESPELELLALELKTAKAAVDLSARLVESAQEAGIGGAIPEMRFVEAKNRLEQERTRLQIARAKWKGLELPEQALEDLLQESRRESTQRLVLTSSINGIVTHADLSVGKVVDPTEHLFEVLDPADVWLKINVLEKDVSRIASGQAAELALTTYPGETFPARIDIPGRLLDPQTHLGTAWATLTNPPGTRPKFLPGMSGHVKLQTGTGGEKLAVPLSAIIQGGAEQFVLVEEEQTKTASTFQKQTVVTGQRTGDLIEILAGRVFPGDRVVTRGSHELGIYFANGILEVSPDTAQDIGLTTHVAGPGVLSTIITVDGRVEVPPTHRTTAASQLDGSLARILVDRGQAVRRGDILAEIVSQEFQNLQLELLRASLDSRLQQTIMDNLNSVSDAVSQRRLWEAESQLNQAQSLQKSVSQRLKTAGLSDEQLAKLTDSGTLISRLPVRATIDGIIVDFDKVLGHVVRPDEPLFEIHDLSRVWIQGFLSERDFAHVKPGQAVRVRFVADSGEAVPGSVIRSSNLVEADDRTLSVWVELNTMPKVPLLHNMVARLTIETEKSTVPLIVPRPAVIREGTRAYVFVQKDDTIFDRRLVQLGRSDDLSVEIRAGMTKGEIVAVGGMTQLQRGYAALR